MACRSKRVLFAGCAVALAAGGAWVGLRAQPPGRSADGSAPAPDGAASAQVVIDREALRLIDPQTLHVPLQLAAVRAVELTAATDGFVQSVRIQSGQGMEAQEEALRLDGGEQQLLLERARAGVRVAEIEVRSARESGHASAVELAAARLDVAKADVDLANLRLERTIVRAPFDGRVLRARATPGAYVRAGEPLALFADTRQLTVEIPVDRTHTAAGQPIQIRVEDQAVEARVTGILPLAERFEPLRKLIHSVASARVLVDNADGRFHVGQTVYAPLVPRQPVAEVPTTTLSNLPDGGRRVQVLRGDTVRDVDVQLLGAVGADRLYVSGPFADGDEIVLGASQTLADGMRVRPSTPPAEQPRGGVPPGTSLPSQPGSPPPSRQSRF
ncbi:MAG TPA: HlyD family efflux transporter periplasmic adaptor subunit [Planctomycetaceae bacterium]|nr:HlyD family efflux transporter periplasmic adaptor subunit [Planctomycetaceae bacterium]